MTVSPMASHAFARLQASLVPDGRQCCDVRVQQTRGALLPLVQRHLRGGGRSSREGSDKAVTRQ